MRDLKRSKKKMYNKQMSTVANSCKDESIMEMEQFERGCKNKNNNNGCNSNNNNSNNNGCCNPQEPQFGDYGKQKGDYDALISEEKQLNITLNSIVKLLKNIDNN